MLGAVYGDVIGSYYEQHCTKESDFEFHRDSGFTDDSVMTAAVCRAILDSPDDISPLRLGRRAMEYAARYRQFYSYFPDAGYGGMFARWARDGGMSRQRSYGNGAVMRVVPIGYAYRTLEQVLLQAKASCLYTHNCREAIRGAQTVAAAVWFARQGADREEIRRSLEKKFHCDLSPTLDQLRPEFCFSSRTRDTVAPALIAFFDSRDYESAVRGAVSLGGDADTLACIAGGVAEAYYGEIPKHIDNFCRRRVDSTIHSAVREFEERYG